MYYTEKERNDMSRQNFIFYAERAHEFPCCDIPTIKMCWDCNIDGAENCHNKKDIADTLKPIIEDFI